MRLVITGCLASLLLLASPAHGQPGRSSGPKAATSGAVPSLFADRAPEAGEPQAAAACPADCSDGDQSVGVQDLLALLADWGGPGSCDLDGSGTVDVGDLLALLSAWGPCSQCGPGAGPCFESNGTPGCDEIECCEIVCALDAFCCGTSWDGTCASIANQECASAPGACCFPDAACTDGVTIDACTSSGGDFQGGGSTCAGSACPDLIGACCLPDGSCTELQEGSCADAAGYFHGTTLGCADVQCSFAECPGVGGCFLDNGTPGCGTATCCNVTCSIDPVCCQVEWDASCAALALEVCGNCGDPNAGNCFVVHGTIGCNDGECCAVVCAQDSFCCDVQWDGICAGEAADLCNPLDCQDPGKCQTPDLSQAYLSNLVLFTEADGFVLSTADDAVVTGLCWWGTYFIFGSACGPGPDDFTVSYYEDDGTGLPGALLASFGQSAGTLTVSPPAATGSLISGVAAEYHHTASHAPLLLEPGVCHWVEVVNTGTSECDWFWESSSDGDGFSAQTTSGGPWANKANDHAFCLNVPLFGAPSCPCPLPCPPGAVDEGEPCGTSTNDGCNVVPPAFTPAAIGDVICGTCWADGNLRDTDWYLVDHPGGPIEATVTSVFPAVCFIVDGLASCTPVVVGTTGCSSSCANTAIASTTLSAGQYAIFVAPGLCGGTGVFDGYPCGTADAYVLEITSPPSGGCYLPDGSCSVTTASACASQGGAYQGDDTSCPTIGACCLGTSTCIETSIGACVFQSGEFRGVGTSCDGCDCSSPPGFGACCLPNGTCIETTPVGCLFASGTYLGECASCSGCGP